MVRPIEYDAPHLVAETVAHDCRTVGEVLLHRAAKTPERASSFSKIDGEWQAATWRQLLERARRIAGGLLARNVDVGDRIAVLGPTQLEWAVDELGAQLAGVVTVGIYPRQTAAQIRYLLEHSESRLVFVGDGEEMEALLEAVRGLDAVEAVVPWSDDVWRRYRDRDPRLERLESFEKEASDEAIRQRLAAVDPGQPAILVYTSGTTGAPKAAMITHDNILAALRANPGVFTYYQDDLLVSFLPMAHVTERVLVHYNRVAQGIATAYASSIAAMLGELVEVRPTIFGSVPRPFEKLYDRVQTGVAAGSPLRRALFAWAERTGRERARRILGGEPVPASLKLGFALASKLVFRRIHDALGGRVRCCIVGAAPIPPEVLRFLWGIGLPTYEAYGMTEATVLTHINRSGATRLGTVGQVVPPNECRIAEDGEILIRGPVVFQGYAKNPQATAATVVDGWLHTGDVGELDDDGYLRITDRKKHLIITAGGKNVAPASIERAIKAQSPLISHVHAHGDRRPYVCALIAPSPLETLAWGVEHGRIGAEEKAAFEDELANPTRRSPELDHAMAKVVEDRRFQELFRHLVRRGNRELARVEKVRRYFVLDRDLSQEHGELTPTMKLKRRVVEEKFAPLFDRVYSDEGFAIEAEDA